MLVVLTAKRVGEYDPVNQHSEWFILLFCRITSAPPHFLQQILCHLCSVYYILMPETIPRILSLCSSCFIEFSDVTWLLSGCHKRCSYCTCSLSTVETKAQSIPTCTLQHLPFSFCRSWCSHSAKGATGCVTQRWM